MNDQVREQHSKSVAHAVANLTSKVGYDPDIVFEGAIRGACGALLAAGTDPEDVAKMLENSARLIRSIAQDNDPV